ncbi:MAG: response regulator [Acidobacteriota bacterium]
MADGSSILFVDDEPRNLFLFRRLFERRYHVLTAESGAEALDLVAQHDIRLVLSDQRMPGMTGVELLATLYRDRPDVLRLLTTGYSDIDSVILAINRGHVFRYIPKPWRKRDLEPVLDAALAEYDRASRIREQLDALRRQVDVAETARRQLETQRASGELVDSGELVATDIQVQHPTILYVDDEPNNLVLFRAAFEQLYTVHTAESAAEALDLLAEHKIQIVVADQRMPGTTGVELMRKLIDDFPEALRIILTGYIDIDAAVLAINSGRVHGYVTKPWKLGHLAEMIEEAAICHDGRRWEQRQLTKLSARLDREHDWIRLLGGEPPSDQADSGIASR